MLGGHGVLVRQHLLLREFLLVLRQQFVLVLRQFLLTRARGARRTVTASAS
ncbi:hypothetical protein [Streptomyces tendae]|uniref:hypothetical protein n=1 Tax=Streptomyces tendae TaxID=1932 RepID=UPI0019D0E053|nr:hypothetical protein [Streptomyces tendae]